MYKLKQVPNDFIVTEIPILNTKSLKQEKGKYLIAKLSKTNLTQNEALHIIAKYLNQKQKDIGIAGTKDKVAVTHQLISIKTFGKETQLTQKISSFSHPQISISKQGFSNSPLSLGDLKANEFTITIRNLDKEKTDVISTKIKESQSNFAYLNYFDEQRFQRANAQIGKALIQKNWQKAVSLIQDKIVQEQLKQDRNQPLKAIKVLKKRELMFYLHAYQSFIFNKTIAKFIQTITKKSEQISVPYSQGELIFTDQESLKELTSKPIQAALPGFLKPKSNNQIINQIQEEILKEEQIKHTDFIIKQLSNLSPEGDLKDIIKHAKNVQITKAQIDELNQDEIEENNKFKMTIQFSLDKGSYATMFIKQLLN